MTPVVLIPGVGLGGWAFDGVIAALGSDASCRVVERPSDGEVTAQADRIAADIRAVEGTAVIVGVSGGATVGLALATRHPEIVEAAVLHEPLVGPHAPALHAAITARADLLATSDDARTDELLIALVGHDTWAALPQARRDAVDRAQVRAEVPVFARFEITADEVERLYDIPFTTTIGARSGLERRAPAAWLAEHAKAHVMPVDGAGNSAHLDAPVTFAAIVARQLADR